MVKRLLEDGLIEIIFTRDALIIGHPESDTAIKMNPDFLKITQKGRDFVDSMSKDKIGYERD
jgi:hypothetical protein